MSNGRSSIPWRLSLSWSSTETKSNVDCRSILIRIVAILAAVLGRIQIELIQQKVRYFDWRRWFHGSLRTMIHLIDSNVYIHAFRDSAFGEQLRRFHQRHLPRLVLSSVVVHELLVGAANAAKERLLRRG